MSLCLSRLGQGHRLAILHHYRLSDLLVRGTVGVTVFCSFGAAWLVALAPDLILVVLGPSWSEVPPLIQALAPLIAMQGLCYACVIMALAINEPLVSFRYALLNMIGLGLAIIALWCGELLWFAAAQTVYSVIPTYYATRWGTRVVGYSLRALARRTLTIFVEAILIGGVMWMACAELHHWTDHWRPIDANGQSWIPNQQLGAVIRLILSSLAGMLTGWLLLTRIDQRTYQDLSGLLLRRPQATEITATDLVLEP